MALSRTEVVVNHRGRVKKKKRSTRRGRFTLRELQSNIGGGYRAQKPARGRVGALQRRTGRGGRQLLRKTTSLPKLSGCRGIIR